MHHILMRPIKLLNIPYIETVACFSEYPVAVTQVHDHDPELKHPENSRTISSRDLPKFRKVCILFSDIIRVFYGVIK
jgi:hypothetical protein